MVTVSLSFEGSEAADLPFAQDAHGVGLLPHAASLVIENLPGLGPSPGLARTLQAVGLVLVWTAWRPL